MTNEERIYKLCECVKHLIAYLPENYEWIEDEVNEIIMDIDIIDNE